MTEFCVSTNIQAFVHSCAIAHIASLLRQIIVHSCLSPRRLASCKYRSKCSTGTLPSTSEGIKYPCTVRILFSQYLFWMSFTELLNSDPALKWAVYSSMSFKKQVSEGTRIGKSCRVLHNEKWYQLLFWVRCSDQDFFPEKRGKTIWKKNVWKSSDPSGLDCSLQLQQETATGFSCTRGTAMGSRSVKSC